MLEALSHEEDAQRGATHLDGALDLDAFALVVLADLGDDLHLLQDTFASKKAAPRAHPCRGTRPGPQPSRAPADITRSVATRRLSPTRQHQPVHKHGGACTGWCCRVAARGGDVQGVQPGVCAGADVRTRDTQRRDAHRVRTFSRPSGVCEMIRSALKFSWSTGVSPLASSAHDAMVTQLTSVRNHSSFVRGVLIPLYRRTHEGRRNFCEACLGGQHCASCARQRAARARASRRCIRRPVIYPAAATSLPPSPPPPRLRLRMLRATDASARYMRRQ